MTDEKAIPDSLNSLSDVDRIVHEPARLMILSHLYVLDSADFTFLLNQTGLTRGNLSTHMSKLEEAGYISVGKEFVDRRPMTLLQITKAGRAALDNYRKMMEQVLGDLKG